MLANGWYGRAWATLELGDGPGWAESVAAFAALAEDLRLPYESALAATMASTALIAGRYTESEECATRALALAVEGGDPNASAVHLTGAVMRGLDLGHAAVMLPLVESMRDELAEVPTFTSGWAMTAALAGDTDVAHRLLAEQATIGFDKIRRDLEWLPVVGFYCHACAATGDREFAPVLYHLLARTTARTVRVGPLAGWWGPIDFHLGALSGDGPARRRRTAPAHRTGDVPAARCRAVAVARVQSELATVLRLRTTGLRHRSAEIDRLLALSEEIRDGRPRRARTAPRCPSLTAAAC